MKPILKIISGITMMTLMFMTLSCASGPEPVADKVLKSYESQSGVLAFRLPPAMVNVAVSTSTDEELKDFLKGMETIKVMIMGTEDAKKRDFGKINNRISKELDGIGFEDLVAINHEGNKVLIKVYDQGEKTTDAVILVRGDDGFVALSLTGDIDLKELAKIAYKVHAEDFNRK